MTHDSFCRLANKPGALGMNPCPECGGADHDIFCPVMDSSVVVPYCSCARIGLIRADERNEIKIRLEMIERLIGGAQIRLAINTIDKRGKE